MNIENNKCKYCNRTFKNIGGLKMHLKYCKKIDKNDISWVSEVQELGKIFLSENNCMKKSDVKEKHKLSVKKIDRPDWKENMSKSLKGRKVGGALIPEQVSKTVKALWNDKGSVYHTEEHKLKLKNRVIKKETVEKLRKNSIGGNHKASRQGSKLQKEIFDEIKKLFPEEEVYYEYPLSILKKIHKVDIFIPKINLVIEVLGCYWHNHSDPNCKWKIPYDELRFEGTQLRNSAIQQEGYKLFPIWECYWRKGKSAFINLFKLFFTEKLKLPQIIPYAHFID